MLHIILADGFEEIEAITTIDILRRCDLDVQTVSAGTRRLITGAHGIPIQAETVYRCADIADSECIILPGGMPGAKTLASFEALKRNIVAHMGHGRLVAAICAAPMVLGLSGVLNGRHVTCYPGFEGYLTGAIHEERQVVEDGNIITANGPGAATAFAFAIAARFADAATVESVRRGMLLPEA